MVVLCQHQVETPSCPWGLPFWRYRVCLLRSPFSAPPSPSDPIVCLFVGLFVLFCFCFVLCYNRWLSLNKPYFFFRSVTQSQFFSILTANRLFQMILCTIILFKVRNSMLSASIGLTRLSAKGQKLHSHLMPP